VQESESTERDGSEKFDFIEKDMDLTEEERRFQRTILMTLMQTDGKVRKPVLQQS
jgi:hypothetical protein